MLKKQKEKKIVKQTMAAFKAENNVLKSTRQKMVKKAMAAQVQKSKLRRKAMNAAIKSSVAISHKLFHQELSYADRQRAKDKPAAKEALSVVDSQRRYLRQAVKKTLAKAAAKAKAKKAAVVSHEVRVKRDKATAKAAVEQAEKAKVATLAQNVAFRKAGEESLQKRRQFGKKAYSDVKKETKNIGEAMKETVVKAGVAHIQRKKATARAKKAAKEGKAKKASERAKKYKWARSQARKQRKQLYAYADASEEEELRESAVLRRKMVKHVVASSAKAYARATRVQAVVLKRSKSIKDAASEQVSKVKTKGEIIKARKAEIQRDQTRHAHQLGELINNARDTLMSAETVLGDTRSKVAKKIPKLNQDDEQRDEQYIFDTPNTKKMIANNFLHDLKGKENVKKKRNAPK
jgi:hypothetical protein